MLVGYSFDFLIVAVVIVGFDYLNSVALFLLEVEDDGMFILRCVFCLFGLFDLD